MTQRQKFSGYTLTSTLVTSVLIYLVNKGSITGILIIVIFFGAIVSGFVTLALLISTLTKKPAKTFDKVMNILDVFLIWP